MNVNLPLDPLDIAFLDACYERKTDPYSSCCRDQYIQLWVTTESGPDFWNTTTNNKLNKAKYKLRKAGKQSALQFLTKKMEDGELQIDEDDDIGANAALPDELMRGKSGLEVDAAFADELVKKMDRLDVK